MYEYALDEGDFHAENVKIDNGNITFDFISPVANVPNVSLGHPVPINIENAVAAMAMAQLNGCNAEELRYGIKTYHGVDRRSILRLKLHNWCSSAIMLTILKKSYKAYEAFANCTKTERLRLCFNPTLTTRTRDFYKEFAQALSLLDEVILCDIYPARELPIPGVTSKLIYDNLADGVGEAHDIERAGA